MPENGQNGQNDHFQAEDGDNGSPVTSDPIQVKDPRHGSQSKVVIKQNGLNPNLPIEWDRIKRQNFRGQLLTLIQTLCHVRLVSPVQKLGRYRQSKQYKSLYYSVFIGTLPLE